MEKWGWFDKEIPPRKYLISLPFNEDIDINEAYKISSKEKNKYYDYYISEKNHSQSDNKNAVVQNFTYIFKCVDIETGDIFMTGGKYLYDDKSEYIDDFHNEMEICDSCLERYDKGYHVSNIEEIKDKKRKLTVLKRLITIEELTT